MTGAKHHRRLIAVVVAGVLAVTGCAAPRDDTQSPPAKTDIAVGELAEPTSFNPAVEGQDTTANQRLAYLTRESFAYVDDEMEVVPNEGLGKVEKISDDPLTVKYTLREGLTWSDGQPITTDDLLLGWAASSGYFDDATMDAGTGEVVSGTRYFRTASRAAGIAETEVPTASPDKRTLTLVYDRPSADWNLQWLLDQPIHVVASHAGVTVADLVAAIRTTPRGDPSAPATPDPTLQAAATVWNTAFTAAALPDDASLYLSNGPYVLDSWTPGQSMTLVRNPDYAGSRKPAADTVTIRFGATAQALTGMLRAGEVDIIQPQGTEGFTAVQDVAGTKTVTGSVPRAVYLELSANGALADPEVRQALMKSVPRQDLVAELIAPVQPDAKPLDSHVYLTEPSSLYQQATSQNGSSAYASPDAAGAKSLLDGRRPAIRIRYDADDAEQRAAVAAIQSGAGAAGFRVTAVSAADADPDRYEARLVARAWRGFGSTAQSGLFAFGGSGVTTCVVAAGADVLADEAQQLIDPLNVAAANVKIDRALFDGFCGLPLVQDAGYAAYADRRVANVTFMGGAVGTLWNYWEWTPLAAS